MNIHQELLVPCLFCQKPTTNPKYCSLSCSAKHVHRGKKRTKPCLLCQTALVKSRQNLCEDCQEKGAAVRNGVVFYRSDLGTMSQDIPLSQAVYEQGHKSNAHSLVRARARAVVKALGLHRECRVCRYSKHTEVCHIRPIASFPSSAMLSEINAPSNLTLLCPNCHWEFDHGLLEVAPPGIEPGTRR